MVIYLFFNACLLMEDYLNHTSCSGKFWCLMTKLLREVLGPLPSFFCLKVKWIIRVNYHLNDLLFISKEDTENIFFLNASRTNSRQFSCLKCHCCLFNLFCLPCIYFLASAWGQLCSHTAPPFPCCLTWPVAFGCWWILKVCFHGMRYSVIE